jgi:hypothetical protein
MFIRLPATVALVLALVAAFGAYTIVMDHLVPLSSAV